jgi:hypothetical protein
METASKPGSDPRLLVNILGKSQMSLDDDNLAALKFLATVKQKKKRCWQNKNQARENRQR